MGLVTTPFVGRAGELAVLAADLDAAVAGRGGVARFLALVADGSSRYTPPFLVTAWGQRPPV